MRNLQEMHTPWELVEFPKTLNEVRFQIVDAEGFVVTSSTIRDDIEILQFIVRACNAFPKLSHALTMIRDADNDAKEDGLLSIPPTARHVIDDALDTANKQ